MMADVWWGRCPVTGQVKISHDNVQACRYVVVISKIMSLEDNTLCNMARGLCVENIRRACRRLKVANYVM